MSLCKFVNGYLGILLFLYKIRPNDDWYVREGMARGREEERRSNEEGER